jgi:hypothetical protein
MSKNTTPTWKVSRIHGTDDEYVIHWIQDGKAVRTSAIVAVKILDDNIEVLTYSTRRRVYEKHNFSISDAATPMSVLFLQLHFTGKK